MALRGAISGFGEVAAQAHLAGWLRRPDVNIVAIHDPVPDRRHQALRLIKNVRVYEDLELMIDGEALDFVDIASPPAFHAAAVSMALAAGANVLVEKPLCLEAAQYAELSTLAAQKSCVLMCVHNWKHAPAYRRAYDLIKSGRLGELRYASLTRLRSAPAGHGSVAGGERWRRDAKTGGGILIDHGWHVFYLLQWMMEGAPHWISTNLTLDMKTAVDEAANMRIGFGGGRIGHAHLSWRAPARRTAATLYGDRGLLEMEGDRMLLTERSGNTEDCSVSDAPDDSYHSAWFAKMAEEFERAMSEGHEGPIMCENAAGVRAALALTASARRSAETDGAAVVVNA
ncbi:MAG: Gfo/Idh/MocA family protein [Candidatus Binataceae bacterium]